jgi:hypothetical protein
MNRHYADVNGYVYLAQSLNVMLMKHIKARLPSAHTEINELLRRKEKELQGYGESFSGTIEEQQMLLYRIIEHYLDEYSARLLGTSDDLRANGPDGGQQFMKILVSDFPKKIDAISNTTAMDRTLILQMIEANSGFQRSLFFPEATFHRLIVEFVEKMRAPAVEAAENVNHTMLELHQKVIDIQTSDFNSEHKVFRERTAAQNPRPGILKLF